jgi:trimethylamine--corrinoid protein Co-methyltransferase
MSDQAPQHRRENRRRRESLETRPVPQRHYRQARLPFPPMRLISDDEVETIHGKSLLLLEEIGMDVLNPEARDLYRSAGARIDGERVRIGRDIVAEALTSAPS